MSEFHPRPWNITLLMVLLVFLLVAWIVLQFILWGVPILFQYLYLTWGMALIALSLLPDTRKR